MSFLFDFFAAGVSAIIAKTSIAPVERVKALLQTQDVNRQLAKKGMRYDGIMDCFRKTIKYDGFWSLWRGNSA